MNANQYQSLSADREDMLLVFAELRAAKFYVPRRWDVDRNVASTVLSSRERDPVPDVKARPDVSGTNVQDAGDFIVAGADRPVKRPYRSDADILGLDLFAKPAAPVYRRIQLPNYAGPEFRSAMAIVDAAFNWPLVLSSENAIVDPTAVLQQTPSTPEVRRWLTEDRVLVGRDDDPVRGRLCSARNVSSEPETGTPDLEPQAAKGRRRTLWRRTKRFVGRMFCCVP